MPYRAVRSSLALRSLLYLVILAVLASTFPPAPLAAAPLPQLDPAQSATAPTSNTSGPITNSSSDLGATTQSAPAALDLNTLPLAFMPNQGMVDVAAQFLVRGRNGTLFFTAAEAVLTVPVLERTDPITDEASVRPHVGGTAIVRLRYDNADRAPQLRATQPSTGVPARPAAAGSVA